MRGGILAPARPVAVYGRLMSDYTHWYRLGPFPDNETARLAKLLVWGDVDSPERIRLGIGHCNIDYYDRPDRYNKAHITDWPPSSHEAGKRQAHSQEK